MLELRVLHDLADVEAYVCENWLAADGGLTHAASDLLHVIRRMEALIEHAIIEQDPEWFRETARDLGDWIWYADTGTESELVREVEHFMWSAISL